MAHAHPIYDTNKRFVIDAATKNIAIADTNKPVLVQYDNYSEVITFEIDRYVEGHDLSLSSKVEVHYNNIDLTGRRTSRGLYITEDFKADPDNPAKVLVRWFVSEEATKYEGTLNFVVSFSCLDDGVFNVYRWNSHIGTLTVSAGINNTEYLEQNYADVLEMWKQDLFGIEDAAEANIMAIAERQRELITEKAAETLAQIPSSYVELQKSVDEMNNALENVDLIRPVDLSNPIAGKYIDAGDRVVEEDAYNISQPIALSEGEKIFFTATGYKSNVAMISKVNDDSTYSGLVLSEDIVGKTYSYTALADMTIVLSYRNTESYEAYIVYDHGHCQDKLRNALYKTNIETVDLSDADSGYYISSSGDKFANVSYSISQPIAMVKGSELAFTATGYKSQVAMIAQLRDGEYIPLVTSVDSESRVYEYCAVEPITVVLSYNNTKDANCTYSYIIDPLALAQKVDELSEVTNSVLETKFELERLPYLYMFHKMAGIGDSLMSGEHVYTGSSSVVKDRYGYSWLSNLARYANAECVHYSKGGLTTKSWINDNGGYRSKLEAETEKASVYFVALGTNDKNQTAYPLGDVSDDVGTDSFTGYYKQIIDIIHKHNSNAVIFCVSLYSDTETSIPYNTAISQIANLYDYCFFVDFVNNTKHMPKDNDLYASSSHFTTLGYLYAAKLIKGLVEDIVEKNLASFKWFGLYND